MAEEEFYNHREVAELFGIHPDTVHKLTRINRIPVERRKKPGLNDQHTLHYPKDAIHALQDKLKRGISGRALREASRPTSTPQAEQINGVQSFPCDSCGIDVPIGDVVSHTRFHEREGLGF
jgi:hypothetical protein